MNQQSQVRGDKAHQHRWTMLMHMDGCHWYRSTYRCVDCSAVYGTYDERDPREDPWSAIWMEPAYETVNRDERGRFVTPYQREVVCERCRELQAGTAEVVHASEYLPS